MPSRPKNSTKAPQPKCLKNPKKPCKKCDRCIELAEMAKIVLGKSTAQSCSSPHLPQFLTDAKKNKNFNSFYSDDQGVIEKILDGPHTHLCEKCSNEFGFFKVKWYACKLDMGFGPGISWIGDDCFAGTSDLEEYFEEKNNALQKELHEEFVMDQSLDGDNNNDVSNNNNDDDDDDNNNDLCLGTEASSSHQPKKRTKRGGKKIQLLKQRSSAMSETSTCNTSQFKRESDNYWNRLNQLRKHRKNKKALPGIGNELVKFFTDKYQDFSSARKERGKKLPEDLASVEQIQKYCEIYSNNALHVGGITALDMQKKFTASGGMDKTIVLFDLATETIKNTYKGHKKHITAVRLHPNLQTIVSGSLDSQIRIWNTSEQDAKKVIGIHERPITDVSLHPTGDFALCCSEDSHWSLTDFNTGRALTKVIDTASQGICCGQFHPDGRFFGTGGENAVVKIWNICNQSSVEQFLGHRDVVEAICFSQNGYYVASGSMDGEVKIWDLRTCNNLSTFSPYGPKQSINCLSFDQSGAYLAIGGSNIKIYQARGWNNIKQFSTHTLAVTGVYFGEHGNEIISSSLDNSLHIFGLHD